MLSILIVHSEAASNVIMLFAAHDHGRPLLEGSTATAAVIDVHQNILLCLP